MSCTGSDLVGNLGLGAGTGFDMLPPAGQAYGLRDEENIHWLPLTDFPPGLELSRGSIVHFTTPGGQELAGSILELEAEQAKVDFNHPLAGRDLWYRVKILAVEAPGAATTPQD